MWNGPASESLHFGLLANTEKRKASVPPTFRHSHVLPDNTKQKKMSQVEEWRKLMKIKNYIWVVLIIGLIGIPSVAQRRRPETSKGTRVSGTTHSLSAPAPSQTPAPTPSQSPQVLTASQRTTALNTSIATTCAETAPSNPPVLSHDATVFTPQRIANTMNGVWIGKVSGEYDPQLFAPDGFLNVDYYMVVDATKGEAFTYQAFGNKRSGSYLQAQPGASKWTYVWCANENYKTKSPRQVHEFVKVSNNIQDAKAAITNSTGVTFAPGELLVLSNVWQKLEDNQFFDNPNHSLAYAGVLFKPITIGNVPSGSGSLSELRLVGEYRGSGQTAAKFAPGQAISNVEGGNFLGISSFGD